MTSEKEITVKFKTEEEEGSTDLINKENLNELGISFNEIKEIDTHFEFPGTLYTEKGVAKENHPCAGSACTVILTNDGREFGIDEIFYYDYNPQHTHFNGKPHWNHERRFKKPKKEEYRSKDVELHSIKDSPEINVEMLEDGELTHVQTIPRK